MGGLFGVIGRKNCTTDLFYGTDYHSHLGTKRGGMAVCNEGTFKRYIHNIENAQFRSKFEFDIIKMSGPAGIGVISDFEDQPVLMRSHLGQYALATVGIIRNAEELARTAFIQRRIHLSEMRGGDINATELVGMLINQEDSFVAGIQKVQELIEGSCSLLLLTPEGIYAARDRYGRTPLILGRSDGRLAVTMETCAFPNLDYTIEHSLGPGEIVFLTRNGFEQKAPPGDTLQICSFLWVYYGYPASEYEGINVEVVRNRCGALLAEQDHIEVDAIAGIPDSGTGHGLGYASRAGIPYTRPFVKYTPTWPRSFMPQNQAIRDLVAKMKLIPVEELIRGKRLLFCEDSIVRGTQLQDTISRLKASGAKEIHMRPACPPLIYNCKFLNFSRSTSEFDYAARMAIREIEGEHFTDFDRYARAGSDEYEAMVEKIRSRLYLTSLRYQRLEDLVTAIGLPKEQLCTYCWDGSGPVV
ncbi:MAG: amidophosphoribosyltransferase [Acidobacteria bacterium]|nr:amidophosphoribosyltransferase [Acidobacteriota bacterium]MBU1475166.1 amidophosphoribosyltransferase [Acidobacteriota bacterium]MBU4203274.1 amidophosphoribosyltransferase [Acidobacteriota bacterium]MBU4253775.1 amidophosphoribosyltransferase [Acidobacteriota bacterium]MBU4495668.1 amidophosphoribosyltransferase [Acidobacteriota bacterium]